MKTELRWINEPWDGKITVVPRPRGGEWLEDEIRDWRSAGVDAVVSLLTDGEVPDLELSDEERFAVDHHDPRCRGSCAVRRSDWGKRQRELLGLRIRLGEFIE